MSRKVLCSGNDCFKMVDTEDFIIMKDGKPHPASTLCYDCETDETRKNLKNYKKSLRHKLNN